MDNTINYTIIIPHKDIPLLLQRCLDSIPTQRDDIQVIIVDDNSSPDIVDFDNFPGLGLPRTEVYFTKEGRGAGYARNVGLQHAKGNRLVFADADDFFMPCFNEALDAYKDDEHDIVYFKVTSVDSETLEPHRRHVFTNNYLSKIQRTNNWDNAISIVECWGKFIKHYVIKDNNIIFQESQYANDVFFSVRLAISDTQKTISNYEIYCITYRLQSLATNITYDALYTRFQVSLNAFLHLKQIKKGKYFYKRVCGWWIAICRRNFKMSILLFFKLLKICGLWYTCIGIIWNIGSKLKNKNLATQYIMPNYSNNTRIAKNTLVLYLRMFFTIAVSLYVSNTPKMDDNKILKIPKC